MNLNVINISLLSETIISEQEEVKRLQQELENKNKGKKVTATFLLML